MEKVVGCSNKQPPASRPGAGWMIVTSIVLCCGVLLVWFAILRENPSFWRQTDGYSRRLQNVIAHTYLPLWLVNAGVLAGLCPACYSKAGGSLRYFVVEVCILAACWGLLATSGIISVSNNVLNLIHGKPFHYHDGK